MCFDAWKEQKDKFEEREESLKQLLGNERKSLREVGVIGSIVNPVEDAEHELYSEFSDSSQQKTGYWILLVVLGGNRFHCLVTTLDSESAEKWN